MTFSWSFANNPTPMPSCTIAGGVGELPSGSNTSYALLCANSDSTTVTLVATTVTLAFDCAVLLASWTAQRRPFCFTTISMSRNSRVMTLRWCKPTTATARLTMKEIKYLQVSNAERSMWGMNSVLNPAHMVTMISEIDASGMERLRSASRNACGQAPSFTAIVLRAAARVLRDTPEANRAILGLPGFRRLVQFTNTDIGVAVEKSLPALPGAAFAAPIRNVADKSLLDVTDELQALAHCTEADSAPYRLYQRILRYVPSPLSAWLISLPHWFASLWVRHRGCAAWVNAPSRAGADLVQSTWPWPMTFSFGVVKERPFVVNGQVVCRPTVQVVMVFDRRIMGGGPGSRLFAKFQHCLTHADTILADEPQESMVTHAQRVA